MWLDHVEKTPLYQQNLEASMKRHPDGLPPYIVGIPVIG
jgi:hypothetical protein